MLDIEELKSRIHPQYAHQRGTVSYERRQCVEEIESLRAKIAELEGSLEIERLRLAACGTAALGYFTDCKDEYRSASLEDILQLRAKLTTLQAKLEATDEANAHLRSENARINEKAEDEAELNATLMTKLEAAEMDAARYRWLRAEHDVTNPLAAVCWKRNADRSESDWCNSVDGKWLDAAIDAAMQQESAVSGKE